ncbi:uncharacterized protein LOC110885659 [Helianthus annuus]|uniref:uncharacterized protein LOC110885659 n=1 Tax=Helianthus annuus TaxID=4232 RepID=UPI0016532545|nr:uncharacterized protein LOC110885659 [Helianthus annuus]
MNGITDSCVLTHGCSEMVNDLALDRRSTFVFSMHGNKIFELSVFNHQIGTQIQNNRVELVVLDDLIYGDDGDDLVIASEHKEKCSTARTDFQEGVVVECEDAKFQLASFESVFNDIDDSKFDNFFLSLLEMEIKKKFKDDLDTKTEPQGKTSVVCDENLTLKDKSKFETDLDKFLIPKNKSHVDPTGKTNVLFLNRVCAPQLFLIPFRNIQLMLVKVFCRERGRPPGNVKQLCLCPMSLLSLIIHVQSLETKINLLLLIR